MGGDGWKEEEEEEEGLEEGDLPWYVPPRPVTWSVVPLHWSSGGIIVLFGAHHNAPTALPSFLLAVSS